MQFELNQGIERADRFGGTVHLWLSDPIGSVQDLPLEIRKLDHIRIDNAEPANPGSREIQRDGGAKPTGADDQDARAFEALLASDADPGQTQVPGVPVHFVTGQCRRAPIPSRVTHSAKLLSAL